MFAPSREDVRRFFCGAWQRHRAAQALSPLERIAVGWILEHPEYHLLLEDAAGALQHEFPIESGKENPFLHLSMHLALAEQESIDQPPGVRELLARLARQCGDRHAAAHEAMECLGETLWRTQRGTMPADIAVINQAYIDCLQRRLGRLGA
jgi:hypothetical protein